MDDRDGGRLLLILVSADLQTAAQLTTASGLSAAATLRQLTQLVRYGFIVIADPPSSLAVYRLNPKGTRTETGGPSPRILLIEDDAAVQDVMQLVLEAEGYAVVVSRTRAEATALLAAVTFDLVITDGFSQVPQAVVTNTLDVLTAAGATPVALFSAHRIDVAAAHAAGFRDLLAKPFDVETLERQVRTLLGAPPPNAARP